LSEPDLDIYEIEETPMVSSYEVWLTGLGFHPWWRWWRWRSKIYLCQQNTRYWAFQILGYKSSRNSFV